MEQSTQEQGPMEPGESVLLTSVPASGRGENISVCYGFPAYLETRFPDGIPGGIILSAVKFVRSLQNVP